jgi:hypothetical protein
MRLRIVGLLAMLVALGPGSDLAVAKAKSPVRWSGPRLVDHTVPFGDAVQFSSVACSSATACVSVGTQGTVVTSGPTGGYHVSTGIDNHAGLNDVGCPSADLCVALENTAVLSTTDPAAAVPTWKRTAVKLGTLEFTGLTCAAGPVCVAWTDSGTVWVSTNPTGGASAWHATTLAADSTGEDVDSVACGPSLCVASLAGGGQHNPEFSTSTNPGGGAGDWTLTSAPATEGVLRMACPSASLCVGVTDHDVITSTNPAAGASSWMSGAVLTGTDQFFASIACSSTARCTAVDGKGDVATSTDPAGGAPTWTVTDAVDPDGFGTANTNGMACPTDTACLVPDTDRGLAAVSLGPPPTATVTRNLAGLTVIRGLACPTATLCVGVDDAGAVLSTARPTGPATGWHRQIQPAAGLGLNAVSCPATSFCATVGADDTLGISTRPGSAVPWTFTKLPFTYEPDDGGGPTPYDLTAISCSSFRLCVAGNSEFGLMVSTRPSGGPSAWKLVRLGDFNADFFDAVSCPTKSFCVAGDAQFGRIAVSTSPARKWKLATIARGVGSLAPGISSVSCPTTRFCLAGDSSGAIHTATRPTAGARAWKRVRISNSRLLVASCRSVRFCVVIDNRGRAWASANPTGAASAWHSATLDAGGFPAGPYSRLNTVACAPTKVCLAGDAGGRVFTGA